MNFFDRNKATFKVLTLVAFAGGTVLFLLDYLNGTFENSTQKVLKLAGAVSVGILALNELAELFLLIKKSKS